MAESSLPSHGYAARRQTRSRADARTPTSRRDGLFETVGYIRSRQARMTLRLDLMDAYNDGTTVGFFLGVAAAVLGWAILSGTLVRLVAAVVERAVFLAGGGP